MPLISILFTSSERVDMFICILMFKIKVIKEGSILANTLWVK